MRSEYSMRISLSLASVGFDPGALLRLSFVSPGFCLIYHFSGGSSVKTTSPVSSKMDSFPNHNWKRDDNFILFISYQCPYLCLGNFLKVTKSRYVKKCV